MEVLEDRLAKIEYHMQLLMKHIDVESYPFDILVIKRGISKEEVEELFDICEKLNIELEKQKADGFVTFSPLLTKWNASIPEKFPKEETIFALYKQNIYRDLTKELLHLI